MSWPLEIYLQHNSVPQHDASVLGYGHENKRQRPIKLFKCLVNGKFRFFFLVKSL